MLRILSIVVLLISSLVSAQFNIFDQLFGGHHQQQQHQEARGVEWYKQHYDAGHIPPHRRADVVAICDQYLCPDTLSCVGSPKDCPCPFGQDKCALGKLGDYVCISPVNGMSGCDVVMEYRKGNEF